MSIEAIRHGVDQIQAQQSETNRVYQAFRGEGSVVYVSKDAERALDKKVKKLGVNFPRLVVQALAERTRVQAFRRIGETQADAELWRLWRRAGLEHKSELVHIDRALYGASYVTVWGHVKNPQWPVTMIDSPRTMWADVDPATDELERAVRVWKHQGQQWALLLEPGRLSKYRAKSSGDLAAAGPWQHMETTENPWGMLPTVPMVRRTSAEDYAGTSAAADVLDLSDALAKVLQDVMVTSEYHSRPRRWATGLEIEEDEDGNPVDPFGDSRLLQSEDAATRFGQLPPAELGGYTDINAMLTQHIGSLTGLPPHYLGLHGDQPANADSIRASETQLVTRAQSEMRQLGRQWAEVAGWLQAVAAGTDVADDVVTVWESAEMTTPGASADAAQKLHGMGVPLRTLLRDPLRFEPHEIDQIVKDQGKELALRTAFNTRAGVNGSSAGGGD